jgi:hypothetical protein
MLNPSTWEAEEEGPRIQDHPGPKSESGASLDYMTKSCLETERNTVALSTLILSLKVISLLGIELLQAYETRKQALCKWISPPCSGNQTQFFMLVQSALPAEPPRCPLL